MSQNSRRIAAAIAACALLGACSEASLYTDRRDSIALSAGDAIAADQVTQMVDPWPRASGNRNIDFNGQKMQSAVQRYRTNKVTPPVNALTSSTSYQQTTAPVTASTP